MEQEFLPEESMALEGEAPAGEVPPAEQQPVAAGDVQAEEVFAEPPAPELSEEQRAAIAAFQEIDADGDGELTAEEIHRALLKNNTDVTIERVREIMEKADKDRNGTISQSEYLEAVATMGSGWLGTWLGRLAARVTAAWAPDIISVDAPQGKLGLTFARDSAVISKIKDESPLLGKVEIGWTLVSINSNGSVLDVTGMDGWQATNLLASRAQVERKLEFKKTPATAAPAAPPVGEIVAVQPGAEEPPFIMTPEAAQIVAWQHPEAAALEALRSFFTKLASLDGDSSTITKVEFASCCANPEVGPPITNQDVVFDCLDVDGSGEISLDELLYAVAGRYMADTGPGTKEPAAAWREAITGLSEALTELEASGKKMTGAAFRKAQKSTQSLQEGHSTGVKCEQYVCAFLFPCYICNTARGKAVGNFCTWCASEAGTSQKERKIVGMANVMEYVIACKDAPVSYSWSIQNWHYEYEDYQVWVSGEDGQPGHYETRTRKVRRNTHFASTCGDLDTQDATPPFQPNLSKANVVLKSALDFSQDLLTAEFRVKYDHRKQSFYASNTTDDYQDKRASLNLKPMKPSVAVAWVDTPTPCYVDPCVRNLMALTPLTAPVWLMLMDGHMGKQKVTFKKTCSGFATRPKTPKKLRDIAAGPCPVCGDPGRMSPGCPGCHHHNVYDPCFFDEGKVGDAISPKGPTTTSSFEYPGTPFLDGTRQSLRLAEIKVLSPDTKLFRFALPSAQHRLGLPLGKHVKVFCPNPTGVVAGQWNGRGDPEEGADEIQRSYTPTSSEADLGRADLVIKVYEGGKIQRFPDGGKMSQYFGRLKVGDAISLKGPAGSIEYLGRGNWCKGKRDEYLGGHELKREIKGMMYVGMLAGGTGITPMYQIVQEALRDTSDTTRFSLLFANQTKADILLLSELNALAQQHPDRFSVHYTLDRPEPDWDGSTGFITAEMISAHLPPPSASTLIVMCGPPPMIRFACKQNLDALGYVGRDVQLAF